MAKRTPLVKPIEMIPLKDRLNLVGDFEYGILTSQVSDFANAAKKKPVMEYLKEISTITDFIEEKLNELGIPDRKSTEATPFNQQPFYMKPVTRVEFLEVMRDQIGNQAIMPSSTNPRFGAKMHSKADYIRGETYEGFLNNCMGWSDLPNFAAWEHPSVSKAEYHAVIPVHHLTLIAALETEKIWVGTWKTPIESKLWLWEEGQELPIDREELQKRINFL